jgi:hypothetical protein
MRVRWLVVPVLALAACSPATKTAEPPPDFPDLNDFTAVNPNDPRTTLPSFHTPDQVSCVVDFGSRQSIVCSGSAIGLPDGVAGTGCPVVRKADGAADDAPYTFERANHDCASSRAMPLAPGEKVVGKNGTCAIGDDGLVACIDSDEKHGFVLKSSGSSVF